MSEITEHTLSPVNFPRARSSAEPPGTVGLASACSGKNGVLAAEGLELLSKAAYWVICNSQNSQSPVGGKAWHRAEYLGLRGHGLMAPGSLSFPTCWSSRYELRGCFHPPQGGSRPQRCTHHRVSRKNLCSAKQGDWVQPKGTRSCVYQEHTISSTPGSRALSVYQKGKLRL